MCLQSPCKDVFTVAVSDGVKELIPEIRCSIGEIPLCQTRFCVVIIIINSTADTANEFQNFTK